MTFLYKIIDDVDPFPIITLQPSGTTVVVPNSGVFNSAGKGSPQPSPQWQISTNEGSTWSNISGANSSAYTTPATTYQNNNTQYRVVYSNSVGSVTSDAVVLDVQYTPFMVNQPSAITVNEGSTATFTSSSNGNPTASIQWQLSTNGGSSWSNISGATSESYTTPATTYVYDQYQYRVVFTNSVGSVTSDAVVLTVLYAPVVVNSFNSNPTGVLTSVGNTATFSVAENSFSSNPASSSQWQVSTNNGSTWTNISNANSFSYTTPVLSSGDNDNLYRLVLTNSVGSLNTGSAVVRFNSNPAVIASGGTIGYAYTTLDGNDKYWKIHTFTTVGDNTINFTSGGLVKAFIVAGGGSCPDWWWRGGGGGGGGVREIDDVVVGASSYNIVVGNGASLSDFNGGNSSFAGFESTGGGRGGGWASNQPGSFARTGGCGGAGGFNSGGAAGNVPATDPPQGYAGGGHAGGGGGAASAGISYGGGGDGKYFILTDTYYGGGGGAGAGAGGSARGGPGGLGGGGNTRQPGVNGLGGGGGSNGGTGGSGAVIVSAEISQAEYEANI